MFALIDHRCVVTKLPGLSPTNSLYFVSARGNSSVEPVGNFRSRALSPREPPAIIDADAESVKDRTPSSSLLGLGSAPGSLLSASGLNSQRSGSRVATALTSAHDKSLQAPISDNSVSLQSLQDTILSVGFGLIAEEKHRNQLLEKDHKVGLIAHHNTQYHRRMETARNDVVAFEGIKDQKESRRAALWTQAIEGAWGGELESEARRGIKSKFEGEDFTLAQFNSMVKQQDEYHSSNVLSLPTPPVLDATADPPEPIAGPSSSNPVSVEQWLQTTASPDEPVRVAKEN